MFEAHGKEELGAPAPAVLDDTPQCRRDQAINHGLLILLELGTTLTSGRVLKRLQPVRDVTSAAATAESRERLTRQPARCARPEEEPRHHHDGALVMAGATADRVVTSSLARMRDKCTSTVLGLRQSRWAIWRFVIPCVTRFATSVSRRVRPPS